LARSGKAGFLWKSSFRLPTRYRCPYRLAISKHFAAENFPEDPLARGCSGKTLAVWSDGKDEFLLLLNCFVHLFLVE
jgi:hypothetical protein